MSHNIDDFDAPCEVCDGTGIGQHGDPLTSKCYACKGTGTRPYDQGDEDDHAYEEYRDNLAADKAMRDDGVIS